MQYYVMKTGLPMFDTCRAYGFGLILERLANHIGAEDFVWITNAGAMYQIDGPDQNELLEDIGTISFEDLLVLEKGWFGVLKTFKGAALKANKIKSIAQVLADIPGLLNYHTILQPVQFSTTRKKGVAETIPSPLDIAATQGTRKAKMSSYLESPLCASPIPWSMGMLGAAHFVNWTSWGRNPSQRNTHKMALLPIPSRINLLNHREIRDKTKAKCIPCPISVQTSAAHYSILLTDEINKIRANQSTFRDTYDSLIVQAMAQSGRGPNAAWKVDSGHIFSFEYLMKLIDINSEITSEVLNTWHHLFMDGGNKKGQEMLALTLAEFLGNPNTHTFEKHTKTHLKINIANEDTRHLIPYSEQAMKGVLTYV